jgi:hypothetical protein
LRFELAAWRLAAADDEAAAEEDVVGDAEWGMVVKNEKAEPPRLV